VAGGDAARGASTNWIAANWLFDLKLALYYKLLGLRAIPLFAIGAKAALAMVTFLLAGGRRGNFWAAVALSAIAQFILAGLPATPPYGSVLFFAVEVLLLLESRWRGNLRLLWWLPLLFLLWANTDVYFVYGLGLLGLYVAALGAGLLERSEASRRAFDFGKAGIIAGLSVLATLVTPYFYRPYGIFFSTVFSPASGTLPNYLAPSFRRPEDYILLLLAMSAFLALGLRRSRDFFPIAFLSIAAGLSFHAQRDVWVVVLASLAVLGDMLTPQIRRRCEAGKLSWGNLELLASGGFTVVVVALAVVFVVPKPGALLAKVAGSYPVAAADYIREHRLPPPMFNAMEWGGFLTWYLPEYPVAIDGRMDLYGDDFVVGYSKTMNAEVRYTDFPALAVARTIVLPRSAIMADALRSVPTFAVAYRDDVAVVLTRASE
jgi:hypothetical protein